MDFTELVGRYPTPVDGAMEIKEEVKKRFGFTVNIGISSNKLLAKMASDFQKPDRIHTLLDRKSTRLNSSHGKLSRMPSSA